MACTLTFRVATTPIFVGVSGFAIRRNGVRIFFFWSYFATLFCFKKMQFEIQRPYLECGWVIFMAGCVGPRSSLTCMAPDGDGKTEVLSRMKCPKKFCLENPSTILLLTQAGCDAALWRVETAAS